MPTRLLLAFDIMDTVVRDPIFHDVPRRFDVGQRELFELLDGRSWVDFETGAIDEPVYLQRMFSREPPEGMTSQEVRDTILDGYCFIEGMDALLDELRRRRVRMWGLSNYSPWMEVLRRRLQLDRFFDGYTLSYETGYRKPDPRVYACLLEDAAVPAEECLFIDDREKNVEAARGLAMNALRFEGTEKLRRELVSYGVLPSND
jgi:HAD superfamily hydrolase (TIGR01509 family)